MAVTGVTQVPVKHTGTLLFGMHRSIGIGMLTTAFLKTGGIFTAFMNVTPSTIRAEPFLCRWPTK